MYSPGVESFFWLGAVVFGAILTIAWIVLPFVLIGTKPLLRELITETRRIRVVLEQKQLGL